MRLGSPKRAFEPARTFACDWTLVFVACIGWASPAWGETGGDWLEHYEVASTCPQASAFRLLVQQRLVDAAGALERLRVRVDISRGDGSASLIGNLRVDDATGGRLEREVIDPSCAALVQALSLVVALSTDESAPLDSGAQSLQARAEWGEGPDPFAAESVAPARPAQRDAVAVGPVVLASLQSALAPEPMVGIGLGAAFESEAKGAWSHRLEIVGVRFDGAHTTLSDGRYLARFEAWLASASYCPLRAGSNESWSLRPCLDIDLGRLTVSGSGPGVVRAQQRSAPWVSTGLSLHAGLAPFGGPVQLATTLGGVLPFFRHEFYFAPDVEAFEAPAAGWRATARAAVAF